MQITYLNLGTEEDSLVSQAPGTLQNLAAGNEAEKAANCAKFVRHMFEFLSYTLTYCAES